jgi:hypothetical protein
LWTTLLQTLLAVGAFVAVMLLAGRRVLPWLLWQVNRTGSRELFTLSTVAAAIGLIWSQRDDRYSELRSAEPADSGHAVSARKVEMHYIGG